MIPYEFGDVLLVNTYPYSETAAAKKRPALVLADTGDRDLIVARITGELPRDRYDVPVKHWKEAGLLVPSCVRVSKIAALGKQLVLKRLGKLGSPERRRVRMSLRQLFGL